MMKALVLTFIAILGVSMPHISELINADAVVVVILSQVFVNFGGTIRMAYLYSPTTQL